MTGPSIFVEPANFEKRTRCRLASAGPQTEAARAAVIWLSGGHVTASSEDIRMTRVLGIAAVLFMAGLLLAFGTALRQPARA
jgi:hypothetical protein